MKEFKSCRFEYGMCQEHMSKEMVSPTGHCEETYWNEPLRKAREAKEKDELANLTRKYEGSQSALGKAMAELASYKKAKQENDERFMIERDEARAELAEAREDYKAALLTLGMWADDFKRDIASDNYVSEDRHEAMRVTDNFLAAPRAEPGETASKVKRVVLGKGIIDNGDCSVAMLGKEVISDLIFFKQIDGVDGRLVFEITEPKRGKKK